MAKDTGTEMRKADSNATLPEQTRPGPVYSPAVDIFENEGSITVLADMPGVKAADLEVDLRESVLTLTGRVSAPEAPAETDVFREYATGMFSREFQLGEMIEQSKIQAKLTNGVLRLELPKVEKARARQIVVQTG